MDRNLRLLSIYSLAVGAFAAALLVAGLVEIGLGGREVKRHYDRMALLEAQARANPFLRAPVDYPLLTALNAYAEARTGVDPAGTDQQTPANSRELLGQP